MKSTLALLVLGLTPAWCQVAKPAALTGPNLPVPKAARIPKPLISEMELAFNHSLVTLADATQNEGVDLLGDTRGVQLEDYGLVFTTEVSLVLTPAITPFRQKISPELAARIHKLRVERMPQLKAAMKEMLVTMASRFTQLPPSQQLVMVVRLYYGAWEDTTGMPGQVMMKASRADAMAGKVETEER